VMSAATGRRKRSGSLERNVRVESAIRNTGAVDKENTNVETSNAGGDVPVAKRPRMQAENGRLNAAVEEMDVEVEARCSLLRQQMHSVAFSLQCSLQTQIAKVPKRIREMPLAEFVGRFGADINAAAIEGVTQRQRDLDDWVTNTPGMRQRLGRQPSIVPMSSVKKPALHFGVPLMDTRITRSAARTMNTPVQTGGAAMAVDMSLPHAVADEANGDFPVGNTKPREVVLDKRKALRVNASRAKPRNE